MDILAECVKDTFHHVQQQKSTEKGGVDTTTEKNVETGTLIVEKYNAWKASLEDQKKDVRAN